MTTRTATVLGANDPDLGVGDASTRNRMGFGSPTDPREVALRDTRHRSTEGRPQDPHRRAASSGRGPA